MKTSINKIRAQGNNSNTLIAHIRSALGENYDHDQKFNLSDLAANNKVLVTDVLDILGQEGEKEICLKFAIFCAVTNPHESDLEAELEALNNPKLGKNTLRSIANNITNVNANGNHEDSLWRKRRTVKMAMLARASTNPKHIALYAAYGFTWSYQLNPRGLREKLIELLLE